jgi:type I restriction enzyme R subunit
MEIYAIFLCDRSPLRSEPPWLRSRLHGPFDASRSLSTYKHHAIEENPTDYGPADYVLVSDGRIQGVVEAKKLSLGPQNVLLQAERYSRGVSDSPFNFDGIHVPFLYATNGELLWFHDIRHGLNRSRQISIFFRHQHWKRR